MHVYDTCQLVVWSYSAKTSRNKKKDEQTLGYDDTLFVGRSFRASKSSSNRCLQFESQVLPQRGKKPFLWILHYNLVPPSHSINTLLSFLSYQTSLLIKFLMLVNITGKRKHKTFSECVECCFRNAKKKESSVEQAKA